MAQPFLVDREAGDPNPVPSASRAASAEQQLHVACDLARMAMWEAAPPSFAVRWPAPLSRIVGGSAGVWWAQAAAHGQGQRPLRQVDPDALGEVLLAPIIESARAGLRCDDIELVQELVDPQGKARRLLVRATRVVSARGDQIQGIVTELDTGDRSPWARADVTERLQLLVEHSPDGVVVHQGGVIVYANAAAARLAGIEDPAMSLGQPMTSFLHPDHVDAVLQRVSQLRQHGDVVKGHEVVLRHPDGTEVPAEISSALTTWGGEPAYQVIMHDISERKAAEEANRARLAVERRYATAVAVLEEAVLVLDGDGAVQAANESAVRILGRRLHWGFADAVLTGGGAAWDQDGHPMPPEHLPIASALSHRATRSHVVLGVMGDDGARQWLSVNTRLLEEEQSVDGACVVCSVSDVTERKQLMDRLAWEARNDSVTGVANRTGLLANLQELLADDDVVSGTVLLVVDIDRFKMVNDSLGHAAGDEVLRTFAHRLRTVAPADACVGRLHGDAFAVVMSGMADTGSALAWAETVRTALGRPLRLASGRTVNLGTSIGVVRADPEERDAARLLQDADLARLEAKSRHRGRVAVFDAGLRQEIGGRLELEHDLRAAVTNGELRVEYQPVATLADGRVVGVEALVRWEHPRRGLLMPDRFIELAEESELIVTLGSWMLVQSFSQMARWRARHPAATDAFVAVNVSPRQLEGGDLLPAIDEALRRSGLPPSAVVLEITESGFVAEDPHVAHLLDELRGIGVRLAVDDFGAGYSSLGQLKRLPVSFLKIDRSFVEGLGTSEQDDHIVSVVAELGHSLGMRIIAEGIEEERQRAVACRLGCDLYQGYLLSRPVPGGTVSGLWEDRQR